MYKKVISVSLVDRKQEAIKIVNEEGNQIIASMTVHINEILEINKNDIANVIKEVDELHNTSTNKSYFLIFVCGVLILAATVVVDLVVIRPLNKFKNQLNNIIDGMSAYLFYTISK